MQNTEAAAVIDYSKCRFGCQRQCRLLNTRLTDENCLEMIGKAIDNNCQEREVLFTDISLALTWDSPYLTSRSVATI